MPDGDEKREYWGSPEGKYKPYAAKFAEAATEHFKKHMEALEERNLAERIMRSWCQHHSKSRDGNYDLSELSERGESGENVEVSLNEFRNIVRQILSIVLGRKLTYSASAQNEDSESLSSTMRAKSILKHYEARGGFTEAQEKLCEESIVMAASWMGVFWDPFKGPNDDLDLANDKLAFSGDLAFPVFHTFQVAYDRASPDVEDPNWLIVEHRVQRFELAASYPKYKDKILRAGGESRSEQAATNFANLFEEDDDYVRVLLVYVKRTPFNPVGRFAIVLDSETVVWDGPLETTRIPVFMMASSKEIGESGLPYGDYHDLLPITELMQDAHSELASMFAAMAAFLWTPGDAEYELEQLGPFKRVKGGVEPPQSVQLFALRQEHYQYLGHLLGVAQRFAMINEAMSGNVNAADSGAKLAFMQSTSMEQHGGFIRRLVRVMEAALTMAIEVLRKNMSGERMVAIVGQDGMAETVRFTSSDLKLVQSVLVEQVDPATTTPEFRRAMADLGSQKGWIQSISEWVTAYKTGADGVFTADDVAKEVHIRRENEALRTGETPVSVLETDDHLYHAKKHAEPLCDDAIRQEPEALQRCREHILEHILHVTPGSQQFLPQLLLALGQQPLPATAGPGQAQAPPEMQPPGVAAMEKPQGSPPAEVGMSGRADGPSGPGMPPPPNNPGTGGPAPTPALQGAAVPPGASQ